MLTRVDTDSSATTDATAPNTPGAGRTLGRLLDALGMFLRRHGTRLRLRSAGVAGRVSRLGRPNGGNIVEHTLSPP